MISPYGTMAEVESTSVISILMYDYSEIIVLFGGWCGKFWPWPRVVCDKDAHVWLL